MRSLGRISLPFVRWRGKDSISGADFSRPGARGVRACAKCPLTRLDVDKRKSAERGGLPSSFHHCVLPSRNVCPHSAAGPRASYGKQIPMVIVITGTWGGRSLRAASVSLCQADL